MAVLAQHHNVFDKWRFAEFFFYQEGVDVFAEGGLKDVFQSTGNNQQAFGGKFSRVACVEPAVFIYDFCSQFGRLVVAEHYVGTTADDFVLFGDFHFHTSEGRPHSAFSTVVFASAAYGNYGSCFAESVTFEHRYFNGIKKSRLVFLDSSAS